MIQSSPFPDYATAIELVAALAAKRVSSTELVEGAIARIQSLDHVINAVVVRDFERAHVAAREADAALARGERRPLLGLPVTVKEQFHVAGLPTSWGDPLHRGWQPEEDALAVARLKKAGAIVLGKTNVPFRLTDLQSHNPVYGTTRNPWDFARTPGGSSGGSAAALAAGYVSLELGSDHGGSLRFPAHFCGIYAHRPSLDVIPGRGSSPPAFPASSRRAEPRLGQWAAVGPMARSPRDLCLALDVLAGPDERSDGIAYALTLPPARHRRLADFRILLLENHPLLPTGSAVRAAFEKLSAHIERAGCQISRGGDFLPDLAETTRTFFQFGQAEWISTQSEAELAKLHERIRSFAPGDQTPEALRYRSMPTDLRGWFQTSQRCAALSHQWRKLFASFDVILCPVMPVPAFLHNLDTPRRPLEIDGELHPYFELNKWSAISCLAGLPATAAPIGRSGEGLPIGIQIIGPYLEDRTPLAFAEMLAADYETFTPPPDLGRRIQNHPNNGGP